VTSWIEKSKLFGKIEQLKLVAADGKNTSPIQLTRNHLPFLIPIEETSCLVYLNGFMEEGNPTLMKKRAND